MRMEKPTKSKAAADLARLRWTNRLSISQTKKQTERLMRIYKTQDAAAAACDVSQSAFSKWMSGQACAPDSIKTIGLGEKVTKSKENQKSLSDPLTI